MSKKLVTTKELAEILQVHENTLYNWAREQDMPRLKLGHNRVRYDLDDVMNWIKERDKVERAVEILIRKEKTK